MKKEKKVNWTFIIVLALILGFIAFIGSTPDAPEPAQSEIYTTDESKGFFVKGCIDEGGNNRYCSCVFDAILKDYTVDEMLEEWGEDEEIDWMRPYVSECL